MKPNYKITSNNNDITALIAEHLISINQKDSSGLDSDTLTIALEDSQKNLQWPQKDELLQLWLGFNDNMHYKGAFIIEELDYKSPPNVLTIHARAAQVSEIGNSAKSKKWADFNIFEIVQSIAESNGLTASVSDVFKNIVIQDLYQFAESDINFLSRLSDQYKAIVQVKNNVLLFVKEASKTSVTGLQLAPVLISERDVSSWSFSQNKSASYDSVSAEYRTNQMIQHTDEEGNVNWAYDWLTVKAGDGPKDLLLKKRFIHKADATEAVNAEYKQREKSGSKLTLSLSHGKPELIAETPATLEGFLPQIIAFDWVVSEVSHSLSKSLSTNLTLVRSSAFNAGT